MDKKMMQEILDDWISWKYDLWETNKNNWNQRDQSIAEKIDMVLRKEFNSDRKTDD